MMAGRLHRDRTRARDVSDLFVVIIAGIGLLLSTPDTGIINIAIPTLVHVFHYGAGAGIFVPANLSAIMGAVGVDMQGTIGAVQRMVQNLGIAIDTSIAAAMIRLHAGSGMGGLMPGFQSAWLYAAGTLGITWVLFAFLTLRSRPG